MRGDIEIIEPEEITTEDRQKRRVQSGTYKYDGRVPKRQQRSSHTEIREFCQARSLDAVIALNNIIMDRDQPGAVRVKAAVALLDRGFGKPSVNIEGDIRVTHEEALKLLK